MRETKMTISVKETERRKGYRDGFHSATTNITNKDHELLKLLCELRGTNINQFLKKYILSELEKNRENLELIRDTIRKINETESTVIPIAKQIS